MSCYIGIDTSNYTTSCSVYNNNTNEYTNSRKLLDVEKGSIGLRQSDVLFHHTKALPNIIENAITNNTIKAVGVSDRPRPRDDSYMPCFLAGVSAASAIAYSHDVPLYKFSHQAGHIAAALYSSNNLNLIGKKFISFHVSGGTTEALLTEYDEHDFFKAEIIAQSLDLKMGQAVDRIGRLLNLGFPAGKELDKLSHCSENIIKTKPCLKGFDCSISGLENKAMQMIKSGTPKEDIALYTINFLCDTLDEMTARILSEYGDLPLVFAGGVMSNSIIRKRLTEKHGAFFASGELSSDNAVGIAVMTSLKNNK